MRAKYIKSEPGDKGLDMTFEYKGKQYIVTRAFTYPETEAQQHRHEQDSIDFQLKNKTPRLIRSHNAKDDLDEFFKLIEED